MGHPGDSDSFDTLSQDIPQALQIICDRCLAYRPQDRFATAGEFERALGDYLSELSTLSLPSPPPPKEVTIRLPEVTFKLEKRKIYWGLAILAAIAAGVAWWLKWSEPASIKVRIGLTPLEKFVLERVLKFVSKGVRRAEPPLGDGNQLVCFSCFAASCFLACSFSLASSSAETSFRKAGFSREYREVQDLCWTRQSTWGSTQIACLMGTPCWR